MPCYRLTPLRISKEKERPFYFKSSEFVNDPNVIAKNDNFISISSALEVDLTGQVCTDSKGYLFYSGIGDQVDFIRGSAMSKGGFSIIILPSTAQNGEISRIVTHLSKRNRLISIQYFCLKSPIRNAKPFLMKFHKSINRVYNFRTWLN